MSGFHSLSSQSPPLRMEKHRYGNAKVFYDKEGRIYYQGQQNSSYQDYPPPPAHSEPLPDSRDYRSYDAERDRKRNYQYEESFRSLDNGLGLNEFRQKGYEVVREEVYDPVTGQSVHSYDKRRGREPSPDRGYGREAMSSRSPEKRPLPLPPGTNHHQYQYQEKGSWQKSFDRHPLVDDRLYMRGEKTGNGIKCLAVFYVLVAILLIAVGIVNVLICGEYHYYFRFWVGLVVLIAGIFGLIHSGDYSQAWKTWCYVFFAVLGTVSGSVGYAFLIRFLSPQTTAISLLSNVSQYAALARPQDPHVTVSDDAVTWVCYSMDWLSFCCLLLIFTLMSSAIWVFNKYWAKNHTSTNTVEPFCQPALFNPWGQVQLGQVMVFFGVITVYTCVAEPSDTLWAKYWSPVWAGAMTVLAGWVSGITGKREDLVEAALGSVVLQIVSLCTSVAAIVLCTLGLVDNINTAQDMSSMDTMDTDLRDLTIASAVFYTIMDAVLLVNVFYTIGGMVRHLSTFCSGIRTKQKKRLSYGESGSSQGPQQYNDRRPNPRYGEYPSYDRNVGNGYHPHHQQRY